MADQKISELTVDASLDGSELVPVVQNGNKRTTTGAIAALAAATNLSYDPATRLLSSSTGADVTLPLVSTTAAGLVPSGWLTGAEAAILPHIHGALAGVVYEHVRNVSGATMAAMTPYHVVGSQGDTDRVQIIPADASNPASMPASGILATALANNEDGHGVIAGVPTGLNTVANPSGTTLYVGSGVLTATAPAANVQAIAVVGRSHASTGTLSMLQAPSLSLVAYTGAYADLSGRPTLGSAAAAATTDFAPAAQGVSNGNGHNHDGGDGAQIAYSSLSGLPTLGGTVPGVVGDGVADDYAAIQAAIDTGKPARLASGPGVVYRITQTLTLNKSYQSLIGDEGRPIIRKTTAGPAIQVISTVADQLNLYAVVANLNLESTVTPVFRTAPTKADAGIVLDGALSPQSGSVKYTKIENIRISNWSVGYYSNDVVNGNVINVYAHLLGDYSAITGYTSANKFVGFLLECTPFSINSVSPQASNEYIICDAVGLRTPANVQSIGYYIVGDDIRDCFFDGCETAVTSIGWYIKTTTSDFNWNIQIRRPIIDAFGLYGIWIDGVNGPGSVTINGGYIAGTGSAASNAIYILNSTGVTVTGGVQILGYVNNSATDMGVRIEGGNGHSVIGNNFQNLNYPITLISSAKSCCIVGNTIFASSTAIEYTPTLNEAIRLLNGAEENTIVGNTIRGKDTTDKYEIGINVGTGCPRNTISSNSIDADGSVTTLYSINDTSTTVYTNTMIQAGGRLALRGTDATFPVVFQDAAGAVIAKISAAGVFSAGAP
jgi:hypothetical protein